MNSQIKKTLIQILVGAGVVVVGLVAMNKFLPSFTLFPDTNKMEEDIQETTQLPVDLEQSRPDGETDDLNLPDPITKSSSLFDEEEEKPSTNQAPKGVTVNRAYSLDKRLRLGSVATVTPLDVLKHNKKGFFPTNYLISEVCPENVKNYHKDFSVYFTIKEDKLVESILFLAVKINKSTFVFKPQKGNNRLVIPNNLKIGRHELTFGYYLKVDATEEKIPYYARNCMVTVK